MLSWGAGAGASCCCEEAVGGWGGGARAVLVRKAERPRWMLEDPYWLESKLDGGGCTMEDWAKWWWCVRLSSMLSCICGDDMGISA